MAWVYTPSARPGAGSSARSVDMEKCRGTVNKGDDRAPYFAQCSRTVKVTREVTRDGKPLGPMGFCGTHDPERVKARDEARSAAYRAEMDARIRLGSTRDALVQAGLDFAAGQASAQAVVDAAEAYRKARTAPQGA